MKKAERLIHNKIAEIAILLPTQYVEVKEKTKVSGAFLLANPDKYAVEGVTPEDVYELTLTHNKAVNHYRRMIRGFRKKGWEWVAQYAAEAMSIETEARQIQTIGGIRLEYN